MGKEEYLDIMRTQIRSEKAGDTVVEEINAHMEDQTEALEQKGMSRQKAEVEAVREMGDPVETGIALDRIHRPRMEWRFVVLILGLSLFSIILQGILGARILQVVFSLGGCGIMFLICYMDYSVIGKYARAITVGFLLLFFVLEFFFAANVNGVRQFIDAGFFNISLWCLAFLYPPLYGAFLYSLRNGGYKSLAVGIVFAVLPVMLVLWMPSVSLALCLAFVHLIMLSAAVRMNWFRVQRVGTLLVLWGAAVVLPVCILEGVYFSNALAGYQISRLQNFFALGDVANSTFAIQYVSNGAFDLQSGTDYVIAYLVQYYGMFAGIALVALLVFLVFKIFRISTHQKNQLGRMMGMGCGLVFGMQILGYTLQNFGFMLATSVYLPLFSASGSGTLVTYCLLGIVLSIYRYQNVIPSAPHWKKKSLTGGTYAKE